MIFFALGMITPYLTKGIPRISNIGKYPKMVYIIPLTKEYLRLRMDILLNKNG